jgi:hypothetical protein
LIQAMHFEPELKPDDLMAQPTMVRS